MAPASGTYKVSAMAQNKVVRLASNLMGSSVDLIFFDGSDNQKWLIESQPDGSFSLSNKAWGANCYASVTGGNVSAGQTIVAANSPFYWNQDGNQIVSSGYAWEASGGSVVLQIANKTAPNQNWSFQK